MLKTAEILNLSEDEKPEESTSPKSQPESEPKKRPFKIEVLEKISTLMAAAFGFVAAFAWNETFKALLLPPPGSVNHPSILVGYSIFVTLLAVILTIFLARATGRAKKALT